MNAVDIGVDRGHTYGPRVDYGGVIPYAAHDARANRAKLGLDRLD
jgi:hypothetical protein